MLIMQLNNDMSSLQLLCFDCSRGKSDRID